MFSLHETTQRRVCRVLFVVLCVIPTLLTLGWIANFYRPWRNSDLQREIGERLHLIASVDELASPKPGVTTLGSLQLADLHTQKPLGRIDTLNCQWQDSRLVLHADLLELEVSQLPHTAHALATWLAGDRPVQVDLHVDQVVFLGGPFEIATWRKMQFTSGWSEDLSKQIKITVAPAEIDSILSLEVMRSGTAMHLNLDARQAPLPAWLLTDLLPGGLHRCPAANFKGLAKINWPATQAQGSLQGQFSNIDLSEWLGTQGPHRLKGNASLKLQKLLWQSQRIEMAVGDLEATHGGASRTLIDAAVKWLQCLKTSACESKLRVHSTTLVPYDRLTFSFHLDSSGLKIVGQSMPRFLLTHQGEPLLGEPSSILPIAALVQFLHLPVAGWLPDTTAAHEMAGGLPLPSPTQ